MRNDMAIDVVVVDLEGDETFFSFESTDVPPIGATIEEDTTGEPHREFRVLDQRWRYGGGKLRSVFLLCRCVQGRKATACAAYNRE